MLHLLKYALKTKIRNFNMSFWPLIFPLILGTLYYFAFGNVSEMDFETVPVAVVEDGQGDLDNTFLQFLDSIETDEEKLIATTVMSEEEALSALEGKEISGIFYAGSTPSLSVSGTGLEESILQTLLESYLNSKQTLEHIAQTHPEEMAAAISRMENYEDFIQQTSLGGKTTNGDVSYFYALVAMACMFGCFIGFGSALGLQANLTALAARRCITPTHKLKLILSEMFSSFGLHFINVCILLIYLKYILKMDFQGQDAAMLLISFIGSMIGVSLGIFIGSIGKMGEGIKIGILIGVSLISSFCAGLMTGNMKDIIEQHVPILNRINPSALIADALYCINVYDDPERFARSLILLLVIFAVFIGGSFFLIRRERYDSI